MKVQPLIPKITGTAAQSQNYSTYVSQPYNQNIAKGSSSFDINCVSTYPNKLRQKIRPQKSMQSCCRSLLPLSTKLVFREGTICHPTRYFSTPKLLVS